VIIGNKLIQRLLIFLIYTFMIFLGFFCEYYFIFKITTEFAKYCRVPKVLKLYVILRVL